MVSLVCPKCKGKLIHKENEYFCKACRLAYPVFEKIPYLITGIDNEFKTFQKRYFEKNIVKLDSIRKYIDQKGFAYSLTLKAVKIQQLIESIGIFPGATVLDIGCREGRLLNKLKILFKTDNYGIDISLNQMTENAKANPFDNNYFVADAEFLPFARNSFDFIFCFDVLEHLPGHQKCISDVASVLKEGGVAIFYAMNSKYEYTGGWFLRKVTKGLLGRGPAEVHQREYYLLPEKTIDRCEEYGLEVEKLIYFLCFFIWAFDNFFLSVKDIISSSLNRPREIARQKASSTGNSGFSIWLRLGFRIWSFFVKSLLPLLEFVDKPWSNRGYATGFFLQVKKKQKS